MLPLVLCVFTLAPLPAIAATAAIATQAAAIKAAPSEPLDRAWELIRKARRAAANSQPVQASETLVQAEQVAGLLSNSVTLDQLLATIATDQAKVGRLDRAIATATRISYSSMPPQACCIPLRAEAETAIVRAYLQANQGTQARQFADRLSSEISRSQALAVIATDLANRGQFTEAISLSRGIKDGFHQGQARYGIIKAYINGDRFSEAVKLAETISDQSERSALLNTITQWAWRGGRYDLAYQVANRIPELGVRVLAWSEVAFATADAGQQARALTILTQAQQVARRQTDQSSQAVWAGHFARVGAFDRALAIVNSLKGYEQAAARLAVAEGYARAGQYAPAIAMVQRVRDGEMQVVGDIPDPKADTLNQILRRALMARQYETALRTANSFDRGEGRVKALRTIAQQYRQGKQPEKATAVLGQAVAAARTVDRITIFYDRNTFFGVSNAGLLIDLAQDYLSLNQPERARAILDEAMGSARTLKDSNINSLREQVQYLSKIARLYRQLNQPDRAGASAESAFTLVNQFPDNPQLVFYPAWKVQNLAEVAQIFQTVGTPARAREILASARRLLPGIADPQQQIWAEVAIVQAQAVLGPESELKTAVTSALKWGQSLQPAQRDWFAERLIVAVAASDSGYALELAPRLLDRPRQVPILAQIATNYLATGRDGQAQGLVVNLQQVAETLPDDGLRQQLLHDALRSYLVPQGVRDLSIGRLLQAGQINAALDAPNLQAANWAVIAQAYAFQGESSRASQALEFALEAVKRIPDRFDQRDLLWQMFEETLRAGEPGLAGQLANGFAEEAYRQEALKQVRVRLPRGSRPNP